MPTKTYFVDLDEPDYRNRLSYRFETTHGHVLAFVVQLETLVGERWRPVVRYDTAHGRPHRDLLDQHALTIDKEWMPERTDLNDALNYAYAHRDLRQNWQRYLYNHRSRVIQ